MEEGRRLADQLRRSMTGEAWHGPALLELLQDVPAERIHEHPVKGAHSIAEIARHALAWQEIVTKRLADGVWQQETAEEDWPGVSGLAWPQLLERLDRGASDLAAEIESLPEGRFDQKLGGASYTFYALLHGLIQHHLYHAGQIAILKKAL